MADIDALFQMMLAQDGSDLHLCVGRSPYIRRHGDISGLKLPTATKEDITKMITEIMPERNRKQFEETYDTDFAYEIEGLARFRCVMFAWTASACPASFVRFPVMSSPPNNSSCPRA